MQSIHSRPTPLLWLTLLLALVGPALTFVVLPPALPLVAGHFGGGPSGLRLAQLAQVLPFLGLALGGLCAGWTVQQLGTRSALLFAASLYLLGGSVGAFADAAPPLLLACFVIGFAGAVVASGLVALTDGTLGDQARSRMLGYQTAVSDLCTVLFGLCGAFLARTGGWHAPFGIYAGFGGMVLILIAWSVPVMPRPADPVSHPPVLRSLRGLWPVYLGGALTFFLVVTLTTQLPFFLALHGIDTPEHRGLILTSSTLAATLGGMGFAIFRARTGARMLHGLATASAAIGFIGLATWSGEVRIAAVSAALVGLGTGLTAPALFSAALQLAPRPCRAHSVGLLNTSIFLGSFASPVLFSPVASRFGYPTAFFVAACAVAMAGCVRVLGSPRVTAADSIS